jgi:tRNA (mo5U34)-methyltransferase
MDSQTSDTGKIREKIDEIADDQRDAFYSSGWWHSIDLGDGQITPGVHKIEELRDNYARFGLPPDLTGKRVLDIGCWDGFYSFEAERHGAEVVAVDVWRPETFMAARRALNSKIDFHEMSVYELSRERMGSFDIVLFLGVLYHLRHPLLALERICEMTNDVAVIETHAIDNIFDTSLPVMEFYEIDALAGQYDNWWGPNCECLKQMARAAGFVRTVEVRREPTRAVIKAYRHWERQTLESSPSLKIRRIINACTNDERFPRRGRHAFLALMVEDLPPHAQREKVKVEIGGYGSYAVYFGPSRDPLDAGCTQITVPIPPSLETGAVNLRLTCDSLRANDVEINLTEGSEW